VIEEVARSNWGDTTKESHPSEEVKATQMDASSNRIPEHRLLNPEERTLIEWLLANGTPEAGVYVQQLKDVHVVSHCGCGCPTVDLAVGDAQARTTGASQILADFVGITPDSIRVGVILHARQGKLSEPEVYQEEGRTGHLLPLITTLKR
jgi:hypothetical protein